MFLFIFNKSSAQIYPAPILRLFREFTLIWQRHRPFWKLVQGAPARLRREFKGKYFSECSANSAIKNYIKIKPQIHPIPNLVNGYWQLANSYFVRCGGHQKTQIYSNLLKNDRSVNSVPSVVNNNLWSKDQTEEK